MKEEYRKPLVFFESFSLTQTIARNCGDTHTSTLGESNHYNENTCQWVIGDSYYFYVSACADSDAIGDPVPGDEIEEIIEGLCYNNPDGGQTVFSSI